MPAGKAGALEAIDHRRHGSGREADVFSESPGGLGSLALFIQLPWGGAYLEPEPARAEITALFDWAKALLSRLRLAESAGKIPDGMRLEVAASRFSHAGWRWLDAGQDAAAIPWNPSAGMKAAMLQELDDVMGGRRLLKASRSQ